MITITIEAATLSELRAKLSAFIEVKEAAEVIQPRRGRPPKQRETLATKEEWEASFVEKETVEPAPIEAVAEEKPEEVEEIKASPPDAIANEKLKQEVIAQLSDLFTAGKVKTLRHILDTYGKGAKSFPEIDASAFPQIKEALSRGEAA